MNKTAACFKILQLLNCKEVMTKAELADILEINPRNITEYIKELQVAGYDITPIKGRSGGYYFNKTNTLPSLKLTKDEFSVIREGLSYLESEGGFMQYNKFSSVIGKMLASSSFPNVSSQILTVIERYPLAMPKEDILERYNAIDEALNKLVKCKIEYLSSHNEIRNHLLHPYKVFVYNGSWFVLGWNETVHDFGYFKLNRIQKVTLTKETFTILKTYDESFYLDEFGMKQNGKYYRIKLELKNLYTVICERIYGKNQQITKIDDKTTILECDMQNKRQILTFVLSFGSKAKVLEPEWLKEEISKEAAGILANQNDNLD